MSKSPPAQQSPEILALNLEGISFPPCLPSRPTGTLHRSFTWPPVLFVQSKVSSLAERDAGQSEPPPIVQQLDELAVLQSISSTPSSIRASSISSARRSVTEKKEGFHKWAEKSWNQWYSKYQKYKTRHDARKHDASGKDKKGQHDGKARQEDSKKHDLASTEGSGKKEKLNLKVSQLDHGQDNARTTVRKHIKKHPPHELSPWPLNDNRPIFTSDGRLTVQKGKGSSSMHGLSHRRSRTLSGQRHSWQEPGWGLFNVIEEEDSISKKGKYINRTRSVTTSTV